jgi:hypothetical protein
MRQFPEPVLDDSARDFYRDAMGVLRAMIGE